MLIAFTYLPGFVTMVFRGMPTVWRGRHRLIFCWLIFMQAVSPGRKTLEEMARWTPATITAWRFGRLLKAAYWNVHLLVSWLAQDLLATLPPPTNGVLYLFGDGSHADKRGTKNPVVQKGRISQHHPWFFGLRFVLLMAGWDGYRMPVGFRLILPKRHADYRSENALFREMVGEFVPPSWAKLVIVGGDAAYGSKANMDMVKDRDKADTARRWGFVFATARTWKTVEDKSLKNLVTHVPHKYYQCTRVPREPGRKGRKTFWTYSTCLCLRHVGDVTVVLSKKGHNLGPQQTKILVTNLAALTPSQVVCIYQKRWAIEVCQTQPIKMTWCPLRLFRQARRHLRGEGKRENALDVHRFSRHDDFADQALGYGLPFFKRELGKILAQQLAKGLGIVHPLLPVDAQLPRLS